MKPDIKYCAIYTRKSSEEGLEQEFNSLNAQYEACLAYIASQKSEGWTAVKDQYDDGGFSGGNMERPSLKRLLDDIKAGKIHIIVVYKIDRLTRCLMDFAKLVETFDKHGVTFVSVTQSFNTTTSMGRLTLNVLLSFAQFEREVTAERIRDKFSASKKKGIWMGGNLPIGYGVKDRRLFVKPEDAEFVRMLYERYLALGSVGRLKVDLDRRGIKSPIRFRQNGGQRGGFTLSGGALNHILKNPIYIGKIRHRDQLYDGLHDGIISVDLWQTVQEKIKSQTINECGKRKFAADPKLLQGKIFDIEGNRYTPSHTVKRGRRYRYYLSQALLQYRKHPKGVIARIPAPEIEDFVQRIMREHLSDARKIADVFQVDYEQHLLALTHVVDRHHGLTHAAAAIKRITVDVETLTIEIQISDLRRYIDEVLGLLLPETSADAVYKVIYPYHTRRSKKGTVVIRPGKSTDKQNDIFDLPPVELKNIVRGVVWRDEHFKGMTIRQIASRENLSEGFVGRLIHYSLEFC
ncbi:MAG: recombinase family protein [Alphaproteobacteria bacterium]